MAPTEILAEQHARGVFDLLKKSRFVPALLTGRVKGRARATLLDQLAGGRIDLLIGTHALLEEPVAFRRLGLIVIDEQHRFGVAQRATLAAKAPEGESVTPHLLVMSATPIPRSLALTLYGDLDVSTLDEKPPGRSPVETRVLPEAERGSRLRARSSGRSHAGGQAYVVVPLIEESDRIEAKAVEKHADEIRRALPGRRVGVVHGRIPAEERDRTMAAFASGKLDVLAATTVIEVGVDVPNASFLVVENAERFGLAQLHQLRGRVGRGRRKSRCVFLVGRGGLGRVAREARGPRQDRRRLRRRRGGPEAAGARRRARDAPERRAALPRRRPRPRRRAPPAGPGRGGEARRNRRRRGLPRAVLPPPRSASSGGLGAPSPC